VVSSEQLAQFAGQSRHICKFCRVPSGHLSTQASDVFICREAHSSQYSDPSAAHPPRQLGSHDRGIRLIAAGFSDVPYNTIVTLFR